MKFYLINPKLPLSFAGGEYSSPMMLRKYATTPLGLLTVAGMIPDRHDVSLCDENAAAIDWNRDCDVVCLTGMHLQGPRLVEIATRFRERGKTVILGGPSVMAVPERYRDFVDTMITGEAEQAFPQCIADLERGALKPVYHPTATVELHTSPMPRFELVSPRDYLQISIQTTRGCPFQCEFCDIITLYGRKVRTKPVSQVLAEVERVVELGWERIFFVDDNFIGDPRYTAELLDGLTGLKKQGGRRPFHFFTQVTMNVAHNQKLLEQLHSAGCRSVFIGIETPRVSSLQETHTYQNVRKDTLAEISRVRAQGIAVYSGLIVGFDHDDQSIFQEQVDFFNDARISMIVPAVLRALPQTPLYHRMIQEGRLLPESDLDSHFTNVVPKLLTIDELEAGYRRICAALYDPVQFTDRILGELEELSTASGTLSNYSRAFVFAGYLWVLLWFVADPNRRHLVRAFFRIFPRVFVQYPRVADVALQRILSYRHVRRWINMIEQGRESPFDPGAHRVQERVAATV